jgi:hypothetical protein
MILPLETNRWWWKLAAKVLAGRDAKQSGGGEYHIW